MDIDFSKSLSISLRWEHPEKKRYYHIAFNQDLFGDWIITKAWGGINKATGRITHCPCPSLEEAKLTISRLAKTRERRGYVLCMNKN